MKTIIKNHKNKNRYYLTKSGFWVRDFSHSSFPVDINKFVSEKDYELFLSNEMKNASLNIANIDAESIYSPNIVIISDGFDFESKQHLLKFNKKVTIIGTNRTLVKLSRTIKMDWYIVNNPYKECLGDLPSNDYYPRCVVSTRTNPNFIIKYRARKGVVYKYTPVNNDKFSSSYFSMPMYFIDDYRNPICAAISLAYKWEVQKLLLFCCDDAFKAERSGAEKLHNGLWMYPQHNISHDLIDGLAYWLKKQDIKIANHSAGPEYKNIEYIKQDQITSFFE